MNCVLLKMVKSMETQYAGKNYALRLRKANRGEEARELLTKLLATSKRILGPDHNITKEITYAFEQVVYDEDSDSSDNISVPQDISSNNDENDDDNDDGWEENA